MPQRKDFYRTILIIALLLGTLSSCKQESASKEGVFQEKYRPQVHFTPQTKWMNDPNGLVYYEGEYHLFYQYYPDSTVWGPMHWGHAVTIDLVHWTHLPIALYPDSLGMIFSGSAVVDTNNTSGFGSVDNPPMIAIFTYHDDVRAKQGAIDFQTQGIAYSLDKGRTWTKYERNPVINNPGVRDFRDPKVFWYEPSKKWILTLVAADHAEFYTSSDLKSWTKLSEFGKEYGGHGGVWECPDLFQLPVDGEKLQKWILIVNINPGGPNGGSATQYFVGEFDGEKFTCDTEPSHTAWIDYGPDNYAGITWFNAPDNRKIFIGWMNNWNYAQVVPTASWRGGTTLPRDLSLVRIDSSLHVRSTVSPEVRRIVGAGKVLSNISVQDSVTLTQEFNFSLATSLIEGSIEAKDFAFEFSNTINQKILIGFDAVSNRYFIDRSTSGKNDFSKDFNGMLYAPRIAHGSKIKFTLVLDVSSVEVFFDDGVTLMTSVFFPDEQYSQFVIKSHSSVVDSVGVQPLIPIW